MTTQILPLWKNALNNFINSNFKYEDIISKQWFMKEFGISEPVTAEEQRKASLEFVKCMEAFREVLLCEHMIELTSVIGEGYKLVHPRDQTSLALKTRTKNISKEIRKMGQSITCVNTSMLTEAERKSHTDGMAKASMLASMFDRRKLLGRQ